MLAINESGQAAGGFGCGILPEIALFQNGVLIQLGVPGMLTDINNAGVAVGLKGTISITGANSVFGTDDGMPVMVVNNQVIELGLPPGHRRGIARGINDSNQIVVQLYNPNVGNKIAYIWENSVTRPE